VKILCKEDVHICRTNFAKQMERNLHETTSRWKTYGKRLFSEDLEIRDEYDPLLVWNALQLLPTFLPGFHQHTHVLNTHQHSRK
jgi:hypothetical protein